MTDWEKESTPDELRFTLWDVPHVIKRENQYLVCLQGLPPQRKMIHLAVIGKVGDTEGADSIIHWVKRAGVFGLMSQADGLELSDRLKAWWHSRVAQ